MYCFTEALRFANTFCNWCSVWFDSSSFASVALGTLLASAAPPPSFAWRSYYSSDKIRSSCYPVSGFDTDHLSMISELRIHVLVVIKRKGRMI